MSGVEKQRDREIMTEIMDQLRLLVIAKKIGLKLKMGKNLNAMEREFMEQ